MSDEPIANMYIPSNIGIVKMPMIQMTSPTTHLIARFIKSSQLICNSN